MATEKEVISIEVAGSDSIDKAKVSVAQLRNELKAAQSAALNGDGKAAKRVAELKDRMEDLKDETRSLQGSGIEKLKSSFGLLTDGFKNFDGDKISTAFKGIGGAMKAIPILLIVEGIRYLIENFDELSKGSGTLATILRGVGDAISYVTNFVTDLVGATDDSTRALDKQGEAIKTNADKLNAALTEQTAAFDRQIAVAKVSGKSTVELEKKKQQAIIDTNFLIAKQIEAFVRAGGELDDEKKKQLSASLEFIKNAKVQEYVITETDKNARLAAKKVEKEQFQQLELQKDNELKIAKVTEKEIEVQELLGISELFNQIDFQNLQSWNEKKKEENRKRIDEGLELTKSGLQSAQALTDLFFTYQLNKAEANSAKELQIRKNQFNVEKAFKVALIVMDGIQGAMKAYALNPLPSPIGVISASLQGIAAAAAAVKVAATPFNAGGGGSGAGATGISAGSIPQANTNVPTIAPPTSGATTTFTGNKNNNFQPATKLFVTETDIRHSSQRIDTAVSQSTF